MAEEENESQTEENPSEDAGAASEPEAKAAPAEQVDPAGAPATLRYWNGAAWTEHFHRIPGDNDLRDPDSRSGRRRHRRARVR